MWPYTGSRYFTAFIKSSSARTAGPDCLTARATCCLLTPRRFVQQQPNSGLPIALSLAWSCCLLFCLTSCDIAAPRFECARHKQAGIKSYCKTTTSQRLSAPAVFDVGHGRCAYGQLRNPARVPDQDYRRRSNGGITISDYALGENDSGVPPVTTTDGLPGKTVPVCEKRVLMRCCSQVSV